MGIQASDEAGKPWHGNQVSSVLMAVGNNKSGAIGVSWQCANPILIKSGRTRSQEAKAMRLAVAWGARVINISRGNCTSFWERQFYPPWFDFKASFYAVWNNIAIVSSAGNDAEDVNANDVYPCCFRSVNCIGALDSVKTTEAAGNSNFGASVTMWAPGMHTFMPDGNSPKQYIGNVATSYAAPFVAGVITMMFAIEPSLNMQDVDDILSTTAMRNSPDRKVTAYINAFGAVVAAAGGRLNPDYFEPNETPAGARLINPGVLYSDLTINTGSTPSYISKTHDEDYFTFKIDDYYDIEINIEFMPSIAILKVALVADIDQNGFAISKKLQQRNNGATLSANELAPGDYVFAVTSDGINLYDLKVITKVANLNPDQFEVNDTIATAKPVKPGSYYVNLHKTGDVDFYKINVVAANNYNPYVFQVLASDILLEVELLDDKGALINKFQPSIRPFIDLKQGDYIIKISGQKKARYIFMCGNVDLTNNKYGVIKKFRIPYVIEWGDPAPRWLLEPQETLTFINKSGPHKLIVEGSGFIVKVFDESGILKDILSETNGGEIILNENKYKDEKKYFIQISRNETERPHIQRAEMKSAMRYNIELR